MLYGNAKRVISTEKRRQLRVNHMKQRQFRNPTECASFKGKDVDSRRTQIWLEIMPVDSVTLGHTSCESDRATKANNISKAANPAVRRWLAAALECNHTTVLQNAGEQPVIIRKLVITFN